MIKHYLLCIILFIGFNGLVTAKNTSFQIIPKPQKMECLQRKAWHYYELNQLVLKEGVERPILGSLLDQLTEQPQKGKKLQLVITTQDVPESEEGYLLKIDQNGAVIKSRHTKGLFYGCQTLEQLMEDSRDFNQAIPCMNIEDYPAISYRAIHIDTKHHVDHMDYYYRMIDKLAYYKVNAIIWELEDKLRFTRRPEIAAGNAISKEEMQALCRYAIDRNVEISPLVQGLGHASFILKHHSELRENPKSDWEFCPSNPATYELQFDLYKDALEAMPYSRYLHVGGDEVSAIGIDERCRKRNMSAFQLQMEWLKKVSDFALEQGRTPIFWDDMPLKHAGVWKLLHADKMLTEEEAARKWENTSLDEALSLFPKSCVYMRWEYDNANKPIHKRVLEWYKKSGLKVMAASAAAVGSSTFMPRNNSLCDNIKAFCELTEKNNLEGILATSWDDGSPHLETVWRGYIAHGEFCWNPTGRSVETYKRIHSQREFGVDTCQYCTRFLDDLEKAFPFFDAALVDKGIRSRGWGVTDFKLIELPDAQSPGKWLEKYATKVKRAHEEETRYQVIAREIAHSLQIARRNRYTLQVYQQLNELQHYPTRLILALERYDKASDADARNEAKQDLLDICQDFSRVRANLEAVYSKTRSLNQPIGFVTDTNHSRHLANMTLNFDWMFLYEIPMVDKIRTWLQ